MKTKFSPALVSKHNVNGARCANIFSDEQFQRVFEGLHQHFNLTNETNRNYPWCS
jgi:hypothetical protein